MELNERDRRVVAAITAIREKHHACTAAAVASELKISRAYMSDVMHDMIESGILVFSPEVAGSLRLSDDAKDELFPPEVDPPNPDDVREACDTPGCRWPEKCKPPAKKKAAARKPKQAATS